MCNGYETISSSDDFMGHRQTVHSPSRSPTMWFLIRAYFCKNMSDRIAEYMTIMLFANGEDSRCACAPEPSLVAN